MTNTPNDTVGGRHDVLLLSLTAAAAGTDTISYLGLGHVFPANMTGNTVLLGIGVATGDLAAASRSVTALAAFVAATMSVGFAAPGKGWSHGLAAALGAELALLAAAAVWWLVLPPHPAGASRYALIALVGAAMGTQSAAVRRLGVPGVTTTYITGTWTALSTAVGARLGRVRSGAQVHGNIARQAAVVVVYLFSALAVAAAFTYWHARAALIPVGLLAVAGAGVLAVRQVDPGGARTPPRTGQP